MSTTAHAPAGVLRYRWLVYELVLRDLRLRYRGSILGLAWTLLNPLLFMAIYTLVFSVYLRVHLPNYPLYLLAGLIPWTWLSGALIPGTSSILDGRVYVGKTLFPTEVLMLVPVLSNAVNFLLSLPILFVFATLMHVHWGAAIVFLPVIAGIELIMVTGIVMLLATLNVFYRDLQQLVGYALTAAFYVTPIFYTQAQVPPKFQGLVLWNPFAALISGYQAIFYANRFPDMMNVAYALGFSIVVFAIAYGTFTRLRDSFTQYL
jgi:ABC-type polysaccharide/polyol phosphate export permease